MKKKEIKISNEEMMELMGLKRTSNSDDDSDKTAIDLAIENVKNNAISTEYTKMPIEFKTLAEGNMKGWIENAEWLDESKKLVAYTSPMYRFQGKVETFRITVKKNKNGLEEI